MTTKTQTALRKLIADASTAPTMRRAATLRLSRLRAATNPAAITRAAKPTAPAAPSEKSVYEAVQSFYALSRQRTALYRHRTAGSFSILNTLTALMPAAVPTSTDPTEWRNFIAQVDGVLEEIKNVRPL
jgi:hypothetical protein